MSNALNEHPLRPLAEMQKRLTEQIGRVIVGQQAVIDQVLIALVAGGHVLLEGVPGLAKTLLVQTIAGAMDLRLSRVQFTPDLMPSDITGTEVIQEDRATGTRELRFIPGPLFANLILADEINRAPPKTQAALLEAMQERQVTAGGTRHVLPSPFFVLATQNPIEQEGTYPLPEAQLDRFMMHVRIDYPEEAEELEIIMRTTGNRETTVEKVVTVDDLKSASKVVRQVAAAESVARYALQLVRLSRPSNPLSPDWVKRYIAWGAGPRASQYLVLCAKAHAALRGRAAIGREDVDVVAAPILRHRIRPNFSAEAESLSSDQLIERLLKMVREQDYGTDDQPLAPAFRSGNR